MKTQTPRPRKRPRLNREIIQPFAVAGLCFSALLAAVWGVSTARTRFELDRAEAQLKKGYAALAAETLEPIRTLLTSDARGCQALLSAYFGARRTDRLEWASQACLEAGVETTDTYIGLAATKELSGRDAEALQILKDAAARFDQSPAPLYRIAQILRRNKKDQDAAGVLLQALRRAPESQQLALETLEILSSLQRWSDARAVAERLKNAKTDNPEIKLIIARALIRGGDQSSAMPLVAEARSWIEKRPDLKSAIESAYSDVLAVASSPARGIASEPGQASSPNKPSR